MDPRSALKRIVGWRWTPCVAPVIGSLTFVVLCVTIVPDDIGPMSGSMPRSLTSREKTATTAETSSDDAEAADDPSAKERAPRPARAHGAAPTPRLTGKTSDTLQSFFRKPEALPVDPIDPDPEPPAAPPPPPPPTATVFTLPEPPPLPQVPPPPGAELPPDVPAEPNPDTALR